MSRKITILIFLLLPIALYIQAQESDAVRLKQFNLKGGIALSGYDPVSYFSGKPVKGKKIFTAKYKSVLYQFSSQASLDQFKKEPARYEPAYGGWCAYAMGANNEKVEVDPETYKIINGKVFLYYHTFFSNTLVDWNKDETNLKKKGDSNWTTLTK